MGDPSLVSSPGIRQYQMPLSKAGLAPARICSCAARRCAKSPSDNASLNREAWFMLGVSLLHGLLDIF